MKTLIRNPHNFVPARFEPRVIAIIGGQGQMGRRFAEEFNKAGYEVRCTGDEPLSRCAVHGAPRVLRHWNGNACNGADVVLFALPAHVLCGEKGFTHVYGRNPPRGWRDKLVIDLSSVQVPTAKTL